MPNPHLASEADRRAAHRRAARTRVPPGADPRVPSVVMAHGALVASLRHGAIKTDDRLDEDTLIPLLSASRNSVRGALKMLAEAGLVSRFPRRGTAVVAELLDVPLNLGVGWGDAVPGEHQIHPVEARWVPSSPVTRRMLATAADRVHLSRCVDSMNGCPAMLYSRYTLAEGIDRPLVPGPADGDFSALFERTYGQPLAGIDCWVGATSATAEAAQLLHVPVGTPLLVKSRVLKDAGGTPREYSVSHYVASRVNMSAHVAASPVPGRSLPPIGLDASDAPADATHARHAPDLRPRTSVLDLVEEIRACVRDGQLPVGSVIVPACVASQFGADEECTRRALGRLHREGLLERDPEGVIRVVESVFAFELGSGRPYRDDEQHRYQSEVASSTRVVTPPFLEDVVPAREGRINRDEHVFRRDGQPLMLFIRYTDGHQRTPRPLTCETREADYGRLFFASYGTLVGSIDSWVHAVTADAQISKRLRVPEGSTVMLLERVMRDVDGTVRELTHSYIAGGRVSLGVSQVVSDAVEGSAA
ncbi:UTRA domain-containing protein [Nocardioides bruguierae]|uniref:UTRA domain-containing protein n=1 Tax=Nocardioides bruguierae TaxID=2945102 RepID=A0A9X2D873_9ACTN|nr:UTRA domain-containing protein [Nocardioides bruguierae]MCM0621150.1 UTRA domain-containing protein [Nocardioides bruguierae]